MKEKIVVTFSDYERLVGLIEVASMKSKMPEVVGKLHRNLVASKMLPADKIKEDVVTMNSRVKLKDLKSQRETEVTITYPRDAEPRERRVSVFSEIGTAVFGRQAKEVVTWSVPNGTGTFEIVEVTYQPEASGHFHL